MTNQTCAPIRLDSPSHWANLLAKASTSRLSIARHIEFQSWIDSPIDPDHKRHSIDWAKACIIAASLVPGPCLP